MEAIRRLHRTMVLELECSEVRGMMLMLVLGALLRYPGTPRSSTESPHLANPAEGCHCCPSVHWQSRMPAPCACSLVRPLAPSIDQDCAIPRLCSAVGPWALLACIAGEEVSWARCQQSRAAQSIGPEDWYEEMQRCEGVRCSSMVVRRECAGFVFCSPRAWASEIGLDSCKYGCASY